MDLPQNYGTATPTAPPPVFTVGSVLSRTFATLMKNPGLFIGLAFVATIPELIIGFIAPGIVQKIVTNVMTLMMQGAIAYGVYRILRGSSNVAFGEAFQHGTSRLVPLICAAIIMGVCTFVGFLLLIIPGLILTCMWAVTIPACVVERLGAVDSIKRSSELTSGYRWTIFALYLLLFVILIVVVVAFAFILVLITGSEVVAGTIASLVATVPLAFQSVMLATIYYDLRALKEGVTVDQLANVFD